MMNDYVVIGDKAKVLEMWSNNVPLFALFMSSVESANEQTEGHVASTIIGAKTALLAAGQAATSMGTNALTSSPYSTRMRPLNDISNLSNFAKIFLTKIHFRALDVTLTGDAGQDAQILTEIEDSLIIVDSYVQSRFRFAEIGSWQPNFFRPSVKLKGGSDIFGTMNSSNFGTKNNRGDLSIGLMLPYEYNPPTPIDMGKAQATSDAIEVYAGAGQIVYDTVALANKIQRYPLIAYMEFLGVKS